MNQVTPNHLSYVDQFLRTFTSTNTREAYERDLLDYSEFSKSMDPTSFSALSQYRDFLISSSAPATVVRKFAAVKSFFSFLASQGYLSTNPVTNLKVPKARVLNNTEAFDDKEVVSILSRADVSTFSGSTHRLSLILLFNLGLRRSELVNLKLSSLGEHRGVRFMSVVGKGDKCRLIPMSGLVSEEINAYLMRYEAFTGTSLGKDDFLIQSDRYSKNVKPMGVSTVYRMVVSYATEVGVTKRVSPHSCRATLISHLLEKNVSPRSVADMVGHSSIQTTVGTYDRKRDVLTSTTAHKVNYEA